MIWAVILAVTLYPMHQYLAAKIGGKQGLAATLLVLLGIALIVSPTAILMSSLGDSVQQLIKTCRSTRSRFRRRPKPSRSGRWSARSCTGIGRRLTDLPALVQKLQPKIGDLAKTALAFVAGIGGGLLQFLAAFIIAGIIMAFGKAGETAA